MLEVQWQENVVDGKRFIDDEVLVQLVIFMVVGFEIMGSILFFMVYFFVRYFDVQEKLFEEFDEVVENCGDMFLYDFVNSLDYFDQVFSEVL